MTAEELVERMRPIRDQVLVRRHDRRAEVHGLVIPEYSRESFRATVVAVGPGRISKKGIRIAMEVEIGDVVELEPLYATEDVTATMGLHADPFELDGVRLQLIPETRILVILEE